MAKKECTDHLGNIYASVADMCRFYKLTPNAYRQRIKSGWSVERALTESTNRYSCKDHLGRNYDSETKMCAFYGIDYKIYWARIHNMGWSVKDALTLPIHDDSIHDFNGMQFKNISEMCSFYKIPVSCYKKRIRNGWTQKDALIIPSGHKNPNIKHKGHQKSCKDHNGKIYISFADMCRHYNISANVVRTRLNNGWTLEYALTKPLGFHIVDKTIKKYTRRNSLSNTSCYDHKGCKYTSRSEMCEKYGISLEMFSKRSCYGWTLEEILTTPKGKCRQKRKTSPAAKSCRDMNGKHFSSISAMAIHYNLKPQTLSKRLREGWTLEKALTTPANTPAYDHLGHKYPSENAMCKAWNIKYATYRRRRINCGWTLEEALTNCLTIGNPIDYQGVHYNSLSALCRELKLNARTVQARIDYGWTLEEALTIPKNMYIGEYRVAECLKRLNVKFYHDCSIKTIFKDLDFDINWDKFLEELQHNLNSVGINWSKSKIEKLRPDFVLYTDENNKIRGVIEFDGEQHQNFVEFFFKTIEEFIRRSNTDFVKQSLWEYLDIPMLRIRHDQVDMIDDMVKDFIDNPQNYIHNHNTYLSEDEYWSILSEEKAKLELAFAS